MKPLTAVADGKGRTALPSSNVLRLASAVAAGEAITIRGKVFEITLGAAVDPGHLAIDLSSYGTKAAGVLSASGNPAPADTVTLGAQTYNLAASVAAAGSVLLGATTPETVTNLIAAINGAGGRGTLYNGALPANAAVVAAPGTDVAGTGTLTSDENQVTEDKVVVIGSITYRFKATPVDPYDVDIGADADGSLANLVAAINASGTPGTEYAPGTQAHPDVTAADVAAHATVVTHKVAGHRPLATTTDDASLGWGAGTLTGGISRIAVTARNTGTGGNSIASTETSSVLAFGGTQLSGGTNPTAENGVDGIVAAFNGLPDSPVWANKVSANEVFAWSREPTVEFPCSETLEGSNNVWARDTFEGGTDGILGYVVGATREITATEVTLGNVHFPFPFPVRFAQAFVKDSDGAVKAWDGQLTIDENVVSLDAAGSTNIGATDSVGVIAW